MAVDVTAIILKVVEIIPNFIPRPRPPKSDYSELIEAVPRVKYPDADFSSLYEVNIDEIPIPIVAIPTTSEAPREIETAIHVKTADSRGEVVSTACLSCSRSHLATIAGGLGEAVRFARGDPEGILHPEVVMRVQKAEEEIGIMERIDLSPESLLASPPEERAVAEEYLPRIRKLRQGIGDMGSFDDLEQVAADASMLGQEFRLRHLQLKGVDLNPVVALAQKVQRGELSMEAARAQLKELLPEEE
ncbi:hypothetical protein LCGC14_0854190 [marine sediment metagenome]|uniref:Uncharacterized protein n=1 Tax=marine sediment metagenome TaxID=412755 RepID=A0A0F9RTY4_9ZZZZ